MLDITTSTSGPMCDRLSRRDLLRVGTLGLGGLTLAGLMRQAARANVVGPGGPGSYLKDRAVVLLFLSGGPSQYETWDPKPDGTDSFTSIAGHIPTALPGVRFASYFPKMAKLADRLSIVRSFQTNHAEHDGAAKQIMTADLTVPDGKPITKPGLGSVYARAAGPINERTGMPRHAVIPPTTKYPGATTAGFQGSYEGVVVGCQPVSLGPSCAPFEVQVPMAGGAAEGKKKRNAPDDGAPGGFVGDLEPRLPPMRLQDRADLLKQLDRLDRQIDSSRGLESADAFRRQAVELLRGGGVRKALDLSLEDPRVLAAYDTEHFKTYNCGEDSKFIRTGPSAGISLGRQLLMARRLCEAGAGFVTVVHSNWDFHARKNIPNMPEGMSVLAPPLDHAVAAFLEDVRARGLEDKILLVVTGEFGRTPNLDKNLGRHHWPKICPLLFAGGGLRHGQVIGRSDKRGGEPDTDPITIDDLHATVLNSVFDLGRLRLDSSLPREVQERAQRGTPIRELF
ncbi:MAG TPA: DUF1501 domain-containing protein [Humisphaera sp.]